MSTVRYVVEHFLLIWLIASSGLAFFWSRFSQYDIFVATKPALPGLIVVTMFAVGGMLPQDEVRQVARRWPAVLGGTLVQYISMPLLAFLLARLLQLDRPLTIGMILVGCVPGAMASNVLTLLARGNTSYSVSLTTAATLLSPLLVPICLRVTLGTMVPTSLIAHSAIQLMWMVVLPVLLGHLLARQWSRYQSLAQTAGSLVANLAILWIVAVVVAANRERLVAIPASLLLALSLLNLLGYAMGFLGGLAMRLPTGMRRALTLEVGMQNAGLGTTLATMLFTEHLIALPPALYTFGCMLTGTILARSWASFAQPSAGHPQTQCQPEVATDRRNRTTEFPR